jgi:hypothetical protein
MRLPVLKAGDSGQLRKCRVSPRVPGCFTRLTALLTTNFGALRHLAKSTSAPNSRLLADDLRCISARRFQAYESFIVRHPADVNWVVSFEVARMRVVISALFGERM